jgi:hypothetical protein
MTREIELIQLADDKLKAATGGHSATPNRDVQVSIAASLLAIARMMAMGKR